MSEIFTDGEEMALHEFVDRLRDEVCGGNVPRYYQWPVRVVVTPRGELFLVFGTLNREKGEKKEKNSTT